MNKPLLPIDPIDAAREVLADRHKAFTVSTVKLWAICEALVDAYDNPQPVITTELAQSIRGLFEVLENPPPPRPLIPGVAIPSKLEEAFKAAKTLFEMEFPNDASDHV